jgi:hypothetical protein
MPLDLYLRCFPVAHNNTISIPLHFGIATTGVSHQRGPGLLAASALLLALFTLVRGRKILRTSC